MTRVATTVIGWEGEGTVGLIRDGQQVALVHTPQDYETRLVSLTLKSIVLTNSDWWVFWWPVA